MREVGGERDQFYRKVFRRNASSSLLPSSLLLLLLVLSSLALVPPSNLLPHSYLDQKLPALILSLERSQRVLDVDLERARCVPLLLLSPSA